MTAYHAKSQIAANRRTTNHLQSSYRCRSHVPRGGLRWPTAVAIIKSPTCRQRRQVLVRPKGPPFYIGRAAHCDSIRGSGSGDRSTSDSLWNLFVPQLQTGKRKSKNHWFLAAFFPPFLSLLKEMGPPEACNKKRRTRQRPSLFFTLAQYASFSARYAFSSLMGTRTLRPAQHRCAGAPI